MNQRVSDLKKKETDKYEKLVKISIKAEEIKDKA